MKRDANRQEISDAEYIKTVQNLLKKSDSPETEVARHARIARDTESDIVLQTAENLEDIISTKGELFDTNNELALATVELAQILYGTNSNAVLNITLPKTREECTDGKLETVNYIIRDIIFSKSYK